MRVCFQGVHSRKKDVEKNVKRGMHKTINSLPVLGCQLSLSVFTLIESFAFVETTFRSQ